MDQEINRGLWLGATISLTVAAISLILIVSNIGRTITNNYISALGTIIVGTNELELNALSSTTQEMSIHAITGLIERNGKAVNYVNIKEADGTTWTYEKNSLKADNIEAKLMNSKNIRTTYTTKIVATKSGNIQLYITVLK